MTTFEKLLDTVIELYETLEEEGTICVEEQEVFEQAKECRLALKQAKLLSEPGRQ